MKFSLSILILAVCGLLAYWGMSQYGIAGSGQSLTEQRELEAFDTIRMQDGGELLVTFGPDADVRVTTDDNLQSYVATRVVDGKLIIESVDAIRPRSGLKIEVIVPVLRELNLNGSAAASVVGMQQEAFELELNGACGATVTGVVQSLRADLNGACRARLKDLMAVRAKVEINGTGSVVLSASEALDASANGWASVTCHGEPEEVKRNANGIASIKLVSP